MKNAKRKKLRNTFLVLFVIITVACVVLNLKVNNGVREEDCEKVEVEILDVNKNVVAKKMFRKKAKEFIKVTAAYQNKEYEVKGAVGYDKFVRLKGHKFNALLYNDEIYYDLASAKTSTPLGTIYFILLAADFGCLMLTAQFSTKKKDSNELCNN